MEPTYYAIIPASVRYDKKIIPAAKLLYGEITALSNKKGYCFASNEYFANLYGVSKKTISLWVKSLIDNGHLKSKINYKKGTKEIENRVLKIDITPMEENVNTPLQKGNEGMEEKVMTPMEEKVIDNNTSINTTSLIIERLKNLSYKKWTKDDFKNSVGLHLDEYGKDMLNEFYIYWTEKSASGQMKFQLHKTWETSKRLLTWSKNQEKFNKSTPQEIKRGGNPNARLLKD